MKKLLIRRVVIAAIAVCIGDFAWFLAKWSLKEIIGLFLLLYANNISQSKELNNG